MLYVRQNSLSAPANFIKTRAVVSALTVQKK